jgi:hypothetical protein
MKIFILKYYRVITSGSENSNLCFYEPEVSHMNCKTFVSSLKNKLSTFFSNWRNNE